MDINHKKLKVYSKCKKPFSTVPKRFKESKYVRVDLVRGIEGLSLYFNNFWIAGTKPWGAGNILKTWRVKREDIEEALTQHFVKDGVGTEGE